MAAAARGWRARWTARDGPIRTKSAETRKVSASTASRSTGWTTASASPTAAGTTRSRTPPTPQIAALASPTRSRPTSTGRAPKFAPSKNVNRLWATKPGDQDVRHGQDAQPVGDRHRPDDERRSRGRRRPSPACGPSGRRARRRRGRSAGRAAPPAWSSARSGRATGEPVDQDRHRDRGDQRTGQRDDPRQPSSAGSRRRRAAGPASPVGSTRRSLDRVTRPSLPGEPRLQLNPRTRPGRPSGRRGYVRGHDRLGAAAGGRLPRLPHADLPDLGAHARRLPVRRPLRGRSAGRPRTPRSPHCVSSPPAPRAIPDEGLDGLQDRATRDVVAFEATSSADVG